MRLAPALTCLWLLLSMVWAIPAASLDYYVLNFTTDELYRVDKATGLATLVGPFGVDLGGGGAAFDGSGTLWGLVRVSGQGARDDLYTFNTTTGAATSVVQTDRDFRTRGIIFGPDGTTLYSSLSGSGSSDLYTVDTTTGVSTWVGSMGLSVTTASLAGSAGSGYWCLVGTDLYSVDLTTAATTLVGPSQSSGTLAYCEANQKLYLVNNSELYEASPTTGTATLIGPLGLAGGWNASAIQSMSTISVEARKWSEIKALYR